jgi:hypothetical protein
LNGLPDKFRSVFCVLEPIHYEVAASADKDFIVIEGATRGHALYPLRAKPGQYSNSAKTFLITSRNG